MTADLLTMLHEECSQYFARLWNGKTLPIVFGDGNVNSPELMLIGEAPGEQEARQGKPFVGKAGKNLTEFLDAVGLSRKDLYISNVVKIRPSKVSAAGRTVNRPPTREEIAQFSPWLYREIALVRPKALVTLGNVALHAFAPVTEMIGDCHGRWRNAEIRREDMPMLQLPLFALYHPASVIYNRSLGEIYKQDLQALRQSLGHNGIQMDS